MHRCRPLALALAALLPVASPAGQGLRETLPNGLRVILRGSAAAERAAIVVVFDVGDAHDPEGRSGLAHLIEHCYVTAAAGDAKARDVRGYMARYPLGWNAQTGHDYTVIAVVVKREKVEAELADAAERMRELRVTEADLDRERPRMHVELGNMYGRMPSLAARNHARMAAFPPAEGARKGGVEEQIDAVGIDEVKDRLKRLYKPRNAILVAVGGFDAKATMARIRGLFGGLPEGERPPTPRIATRMKPAAAVSIEVPKPRFGDGRGHAAIAYRAPRPDDPTFAAFLVLTASLSRAAARERTRAQEGDAPTYVWTPLDGPEVATIAAPIEAAADPVAHLRRLIADWTTIDPDSVTKMRRDARNVHGFIMGLTTIPDAWIARGNIYGIAFGMARRAQLGIEPEKLGKAIDAVTEEDLRGVAATVFGPERGSAAAIAVRDS